MANNPDVSYRAFPGEFNAVNPAEVPQGAAQSIVNGVVRNQGVLEPIRGFSRLPYPVSSGLPPNVIGVLDSSSFVSIGPEDNYVPADAGGPPLSTAAELYTLNNIGSFLNIEPFRSPGFDAGIPLPSTAHNLGFFAAQRQGWVATGRGLFKVERANLGGVLSPYIFPTALPTIPVCEYQNFVQNINYGCFAAPSSSTLPASSFWLPANYSVAYRVLVARKDPLTNQVRYGEPSSRFVVYNTIAGPVYVQLMIPIPVGMPPDGFIQIYRSLAAPPGIPPSDEMYLVTELTLPAGANFPGNYIDSTPRTKGPAYWNYFPHTATVGASTGWASYLNYQDISPGRQDDPANAQIYVPLYTNRGLGNGAQSRKTPAPKANIVGYFGGRAYFGDTENQQVLTLLLAGVDKTSAGVSLQSGDTITIDGVTYTADNTGATIQGTFQIATATASITGWPQSPASAVHFTAMGLIGAISNYYARNNPALPLDQVIQADYLSSGQGGDEGQILLRRIRPGSPPFTVSTSSTRGWAQDYTTGYQSNNSAAPGGIIWSDITQPDSCPLGNQTILGSPGARVVGFQALRDFAIIFKEDGAWTVRETQRGPQFTSLDTSIRIVSPRCIVAIGNECLALTTQGVVRIGEFGIENVSQPIQREILGYIQRSQGLFTGAFAIGYEAEREYWLCLPSSGTITQADIVKIFNTKTNAWTTAKIAPFTCGAEVPTSSSTARVATTALAFGSNNFAALTNPSRVGILLENKSQSNIDYILPTVNPTLTAVGNNNDGTYRVRTDPTWYGKIPRGSLFRSPSDTVQQTYVVNAVTLSSNQADLFLDLKLNTSNSPSTTVFSLLVGGASGAQIGQPLAGVTCSRASSAYVDLGNGQLKLVGPNVLRVESKGILHEIASTNYIPRSLELWDHANAGADWTAFGAVLPTTTPSFTTEVAAPDGTLTACKAVWPVVPFNTVSWLWCFANTPNPPQTLSVYMRMPAGQTGIIYIHTRDNRPPVECRVTDQWQRFYVAGSGYAVIGYGTDIGSAPGGTGGTFYLWGSQTENIQTWPTSFIYTNGAAASRSYEGVNFPNPLNPSNPVNWSMSIKATPQGNWADMINRYSGAFLVSTNSGGALMKAGGFSWSAGDSAQMALDSMVCSVTDNVNTYGQLIQKALVGAQPTTFKVIDTGGVVTSVPAGTFVGTSPIANPINQTPTVNLGDDTFGTTPFGGWISDIVYTTRTSAIPVPVLTSSYIQPAIVTSIKFMPEDADAPLLEKHWDGIYLWYRYWSGSFMTVGWETEKTPFPIYADEGGPGGQINKWGVRPWCKSPWLSPATNYVCSTSLDPVYSRSGLLTTGFTWFNAQSRFELSAVTYNIASTTDRIIIE